jgi:hypothetical protein
MDSEYIALDDAASVAHWCEWFGCSEAELFRAVWHAGAHRDDVDRFLRGGHVRPAPREPGESDC